MPLQKSLVQKRINGVFFEFNFDYDSAIKAMYYGVYENDTVALMRRFLKKGDTFIDVGASIGYLSAIALGLVGKTGQVHSFEPVSKYFKLLKNFADMNKDFKIVVNQCALGDSYGKRIIYVTNLQNIGWNTLIPGYMEHETIEQEIEVEVWRLDTYIKKNAIENISLIKIDVEGFEFPCLKGLNDYLENANNRPIIICEVAPLAYPLLGYALSQLQEYIKKYNYHAVSISNINRGVDITKLKKTTTVVLMPKV